MSSDLSAPQTVPISAVIPAYNRAATIGRALSSVAAQRGFRPAEVMVVDDGSVDGTSEIAERMGARVVRHEQNRGVGAARNSGIEEATQPWVALLDSDDEWLPDHLSTVWALRNGHVLVADTALRCGKDPLGFKLYGPLSRTPQQLRDPTRLVFPGDTIPPSATLIKRDFLLQAGGFRSMERGSDFDMWLRLLEEGTALLSPHVGVIYDVVGDDRLTADPAPAARVRAEVIRHYASRPWYSDRLVERWWGLVIWDRTRHALRQGRYLDAARNVLRMAASPQRMYGASRFSVSRTRIFRARARIARNGQPSLAILIRDPEVRARTLNGLDGRQVIDLSASRRIAAYAHLLHRPTANAIVDSSLGAHLLKLARIQIIPVGREIRVRRDDE